jgi:hypothetical protein
MRSVILAFGLMLVSSSAFAYKDGLYSCKNIDGLPDNTYKIQSVSVDGLSRKVPYIEIVRHRRDKRSGDSNAPIVQTRIEGFATVASSSTGLEVLMVAAIQLEFEGDRLVGCKQ